MKKFFIAITSAALLFGLSVCHSNASNANKPEGNRTTVAGPPPQELTENPASDFEYKQNPDFGGIEITKCISEADMVRIPEKIDGEPVTVIGKRAFVVLEKLEKVIIPGSVKIIGDEAFQNCNNLVRIDIPDNVQSIGSYAFWSCNKMTNVKIGKNVSKIGHSAFGNCVNLTDVIISDSVISIAGHAFTNCRSLKNILIPANVKNIEDGAFGCYVKYEKGKTFTGVIAIFKGKKYNSQLISRIRVIATGEIERELYDLPFTFYNAVNENK